MKKVFIFGIIIVGAVIINKEINQNARNPKPESQDQYIGHVEFILVKSLLFKTPGKQKFVSKPLFAETMVIPRDLKGKKAYFLPELLHPKSRLD